MGFREIRQSGSLLHKEAVNSYFKLISKTSWKVAEISIFCENKRVHLSDLNLEILKRVMHQRDTGAGYFSSIKQIMKCLFH